MGEYDAVWVFFFSAIFVGFYIFIEARPKGSTFIKNITNTFLVSLEKDNYCLLIINIPVFFFVFLALALGGLIICRYC
jgi:hypothetical protein